MFLGWLTGAGPGHPTLYVRQLSDVKIKPQIEVAVPKGTAVYARYTGMALARAHARSGDAVLLAAYMGDSEAFEDAMADFAVAYADQTERDHEALVMAVRAGRIEIRSDA
jgi:predicted alpha/beta hydrolase